MRKLISIILISLLTFATTITIAHANTLTYKLDITVSVDRENQIEFSLNVDPGTTYQLSSSLANTDYDFLYWIVDGTINRNLAEFHTFIINKDTKLVAVYGNPIEIDLPTNPDDYVTVNELPTTTGHIFKTGGEVGKVSVMVDGRKVNLYITYNDLDYFLESFTLANGTDMTPFLANNAFYYTYQNQKYVVLNHDPHFSLFTHQDGFWPYTVINLSTFEFKTFNQLKVHLHVEGESDREDLVYGYFYVDQLLIEKLTSVTMSFNYRYVYPLGVTGKYQSHIQKYQDETVVTVGPRWWWEKIAFSLPTTSADAIYGKNKALASIQHEYININEILPINKNSLSPKTLTTIETAYRSKDNSFDSIKSDLSIFKIFIGQFKHNLSQRIQLYNNLDNPNDPMNLSIAEFSYVTDGQYNIIKGKDIELNLNLGENVGPVTANDNLLLRLWNSIRPFLVQLALVASVYFAYKEGVFRDRKKTIIYLIIVAAVIFYFGLI